MPVRKIKLVVSPNARRDVRAVLIYTERTWGKVQRKKYRTLIDLSLEELLQFPEIGILRPEYGEDVRSLPVGQHVILYHLREHEILIARFVHSSRDITRLFNDPGT